jgi:hypothetical protein
LSVPATVTVVAPVATTVRVEEAPALMEDGFAVMVTVGGPGSTTVTVAVATAGVVPDAPEAVAVYVVVAPGVTDWVPPVVAKL